MKKKMIVYGYTMDMGGAERALINVLNILVKYYYLEYPS